MAYGYAKPSGDYRSQGILSLLENMATPKGGAVSDREMSYFMDKDTGTEFDPLKTPTRTPEYNETMASLIRNDGSTMAGAMTGHEFAHMAQQEGNTRALVAGLSGEELQKRFAEILSQVSPQEQVPVIRDFSRSSDDGKMQLMRMIVDNPALIRSYGIQDEVPVNNLGF